MDSKRSLTTHTCSPVAFHVFLSHSHYNCSVFLLLLPIINRPFEVREGESQATWGLPFWSASEPIGESISDLAPCRIALKTFEDTRNLKDEIMKSRFPQRCSMHLGRRRQCRPYISLDPPCLASIHYVVTLPEEMQLHKLINNTFYQTASYDAFRICSLGGSGW